jgi:hypothetical protein
MDIDKELEEIFNDPLLNLSDKEKDLFDIPKDMGAIMSNRNKADYVAQRKLCENFDEYRELFIQVHKDLKNGKRSLVRLAKTENIEVGSVFVIGGQLVYLESMDEAHWTENVRGRNGRTRCIYENGTETDILLQTLRKSVMTEGFVVTKTEKEIESEFFVQEDINTEDKVTGYIYVLKSLSTDEDIKNQKDLYKIGFTTNCVEERIANAEHEPTYLMAPVKIIATYKVVNLNSQKFEDLIHKVLKSAQFHVTVNDDNGEAHEPKEWFVVPIEIVDAIILKILDGSIINYTYNTQLKCLEKL